MLQCLLTIFKMAFLIYISLLHISANGEVLKSEVIPEVQNWVILNDVQENTGYHLLLHTLYGNDPNDSIRSVASNFTFTIPESTFINIQKQSLDRQSLYNAYNKIYKIKP